MPEEIELRVTGDGLEVGSTEVEKIQSIILVVKEPEPAKPVIVREVDYTKITTLTKLREFLKEVMPTVTLPGEPSPILSKYLKPKV